MIPDQCSDHVRMIDRIVIYCNDQGVWIRLLEKGGYEFCDRAIIGGTPVDDDAAILAEGSRHIIGSPLSKRVHR